MTDPTRLDLPGGEWVLWARDGVAALMPSLPDGLVGTPVETAYRLRVEANLSGHCPSCHALADIEPLAPRQARGRLEHETDCLVGGRGVVGLQAEATGPT